MTGRAAASTTGQRVRRDRDNPLPLYHQVAAGIRDQIRAGTLGPGARLASESALSQQAGVSRMTARQAIALLVADGLVVVRHGVGTFVAEPKLTYDALHLLGFSETLAAQGSTTTSDVLEQAVVPASPHVATALGVEAGSPVVTVRRIRRAHGEPLVLEASYLPHALCGGLEKADLTGRSLYATLESDFGLRLAGARQHFAARGASAAERAHLDLAKGACIMALWGVSEDYAGEPVEYFEATYRADRFEFAASSRRPRAGRGGPGGSGTGDDANPLRVVLTDSTADVAEQAGPEDG
ncbi:GntR family transcriptional regulator [Actinopolymorpha sp. B9G3]|uniref:GntR family transcriptional regulator n=1 Tax=Actinopolymorpha sp. B9G3 TaxID=3158970 RepID=UPI0032D966B6